MSGALASRPAPSRTAPSTDEFLADHTIGREFFAPLDDIDIEAIAADYEIGRHSKKHELEHHLKVAILEGIDPSDSLRTLATKTATHDGVEYMAPSRFSELTNGRNYRAAAQTFFELLHTPQVRRRHGTSAAQLDWLNRGVIATDASQLSIEAPITVPSELREADEDRVIRAAEGGLKLNVALRVDTECKLPVSVVVTPPNDHETTQFDHLQEDIELFPDLDNPIDVWDRGYTDYDRFVERKGAGKDFVTTLKANATTSIVEPLEEITISADDGAWHVADDLIELGETGETFRRVTGTDPDDEVTEYLTTLPAERYAPIDVMEIYTLRTMIEIFFRENKQNTNIQDFHSTTVNGALFELFCTLIGWVLMELYRGRYPVRDGASGAIRKLQTEWNQPLVPAGHLGSVSGYG